MTTRERARHHGKRENRTKEEREEKTACDSDDAEQGCSAAFTCACRCTRRELECGWCWTLTIGRAPLAVPSTETRFLFLSRHVAAAGNMDPGVGLIVHISVGPPSEKGRES